ncbi:MAG: hypothetical protein M3P83_12305, partial [Actinomycetota bacterium]|nr:hypothetical protein [Actinomycetota bacterium]
MRRADVGTPVLVCGLVAVLALVPPAVGDPGFYLVGDSAVQFLPTWFHLGETVRSGIWPPWLDPGAWAGGNYAAEALFGIYNPLHVANWVLVSLLPDLAVAAVVVKAEFLALLALGVYLLAREYGAARWAAAVVGVALPFSGYTLYWDAASWASGLLAFSYTPHVWWSLRKVARGRLNPVWAVLVGALAVTQGNPYGVVGVVAVGLALTVETALRRDRQALLCRLLPTGVCIAAVVPLVFLPLLSTTPLTHRSALGGLHFGDFMAPDPTELALLSTPTYLPDVDTVVDPMRVPATYLAWFVLPLLPWLRWQALRTGWRERSGLLVFTGFYLLLTLGPTKLWMFRWPLRLVEYLHLGVLVALAVALTAGWRTDQHRARAVASVGLVLFGGG